jgi:RNA polymerase sigma-19 factor, ECF subfamily
MTEKYAPEQHREPGDLVDRYDRELRQYLARRLANKEDALDLAQEVYLRLLRLHKAELAVDCPAYFFTVAANVAREFRRRARRQPVTFDSGVVEQWSEQPTRTALEQPEEELATRRELVAALEQLNPTLRDVLLLTKRDGLSYAAAACELNLSVHTVKKYVARALSILRTSARERSNAPSWRHR